jgi:hypothetical protein
MLLAARKCFTRQGKLQLIRLKLTLFSPVNEPF